ncbi:MAG: PfkB family carbohydrate kinase [Granulosicoccus sp.]
MICNEEKPTTSVLVVGNVTIDELYAVRTLPRPGESITGTLRVNDVGGKGANVATLLSRCGLPTRFTTAVGNDERGAHVQSRLSLESLQLDIEVLPSIPTDVSLIFSDEHGENTIVTTTGATHHLQQMRVINALDQLRPKDVLVLQANLTEAMTRFAINHAKRRDLQIVFNPSPFAPWVKQVINGVDILFVNAEESQDLAGSCDEAAVRALLEQGPSQVVVTLGEQGALLGSDTIISVPAVHGEVVDTTGAGDTFLAVAVASACLRGTRLDRVALRHAALAAAGTISNHGTRSAFPSAKELVRILSVV